MYLSGSLRSLREELDSATTCLLLLQLLCEVEECFNRFLGSYGAELRHCGGNLANLMGVTKMLKSRYKTHLCSVTLFGAYQIDNALVFGGE